MEIILNAEFFNSGIELKNPLKENKYYYTIYKDDDCYITIKAVMIYNNYKFMNTQLYRKEEVSLIGLDYFINQTLKAIEQK